MEPTLKSRFSTFQAIALLALTGCSPCFGGEVESVKQGPPDTHSAESGSSGRLRCLGVTGVMEIPIELQIRLTPDSRTRTRVDADDIGLKETNAQTLGQRETIPTFGLSYSFPVDVRLKVLARLSGIRLETYFRPPVELRGRVPSPGEFSLSQIDVGRSDLAEFGLWHIYSRALLGLDFEFLTFGDLLRLTTLVGFDALAFRIEVSSGGQTASSTDLFFSMIAGGRVQIGILDFAVVTAEMVAPVRVGNSRPRGLQFRLGAEFSPIPELTFHIGARFADLRRSASDLEIEQLTAIFAVTWSPWAEDPALLPIQPPWETPFSVGIERAD